ncbi:MAG TPA: redox-regulated ATPase YchF [Candidatus Babeliales bacterium]|nr:redox-regulated ATPase YchF [Candidatus Babeliales bacterium]
MSIKAGLVGLPNVGKSTLFNALTKSSIPMENYPFCTIDPHVAITEVPDERLEQLQKIYNSGKIIPATVTFVDIAGLVKGAATGEGLGNQFLSNIREVDLILHVLRCFEDPNIVRSTDVDPISDFEIIMAELMLKDIESIDKRIPKVEKSLKGKLTNAEQKNFNDEMEALKTIRILLEKGDATAAKEIIKQTPAEMIPLLSTKNFLVIANIAEGELEDKQYLNNKHYQALVKHFGPAYVIPISARVEYELTQMDLAEAQEFMDMMGIVQPSLDIIIKKTYDNLGLITFFTCGPKEIHAWPVRKGTTIRQAGGEIHSDIERGFICSETFSFNDLIALKTENAIKVAGKLRIEGQHYLVQDGDIVHIRFNV